MNIFALVEVVIRHEDNVALITRYSVCVLV